MSGTDRTDAHDLGRMQKLEDRLQRLLTAVEDRLKDAPPAPRMVVAPRRPASWLDPIKDGDLRQLAVIGGLAVLLVAAGWVGSSLFYGSRLKSQVEAEIGPYAAELADTVTTIQTDLAPRMAVANELKAEIDRARRDLLERDGELDATIADAEGKLLDIRDSAIDDIEKRLTDQTDDLSTMLEAFRQRAVELDQGLNEVGQALAAFDHQLPVITDSFGEIAAKLVESKAILDRHAEQVAAIEGKAPPLEAKLDLQRQTLDSSAKTLSILTAQLEALKTQTTRSSEQLDRLLDEGRRRMASWQSADQEIETKKRGIMHNLDNYADSLNTKVREFIEVLNREPAFTGG